jgi:hypothetical protein
VYARIAGNLDQMLHAAERVPGAAADAAGGVEQFGAAADLAAQATGHLGGALNKAHDAFLDFQGAEIDAEDALDRMQEALDESNGSMNVHNERGRDARESVLRFARAARDAAQAKFDETGSVKAANAVYEGYRRQLINTLIEAGHTRKEAEKLARQWMAYNEMPNITKTITTIHNDEYRTHRQGERSSSGRAAGGSVLADRPYTVHEQQMEGFFFTPPVDGFVAPLASMPMFAMAGAAAGGGTTTTVRHVVDLQLNGRTIRELAIDDAVGRQIPEATIRLAYP